MERRVGGLERGFRRRHLAGGCQTQGRLAEGLRTGILGELVGQGGQLGAADPARSVREIGAVEVVGRAELHDVVVAEAREEGIEILVGLRLQRRRVTRLTHLPILVVLGAEVRDIRGVEAAEDQLQVVEVGGPRVGDLLNLCGDVIGQDGSRKLGSARLGLDGRGVELRDLRFGQAGALIGLELRDLSRDARDQRIAGNRGGMRRGLHLGERRSVPLDRVGRIEAAAVRLRAADRPVGGVITREVGVIDVAVAAVLLVQHPVLQRAVGFERLDRVVDVGLHRAGVGDARILRLAREQGGIVGAFAGLLAEGDLEARVVAGRVGLLVPIGPVSVVVALAGALVGAERALELQVRILGGEGEILPHAVDELGRNPVVAHGDVVDVEQIPGVDLDVDVAVGRQAVQAQVARKFTDADRTGRRDVGLVAGGGAAVELDRGRFGAEATARDHLDGAA